MRSRVMMYNDVVQFVLIYGRKSWVVIDSMMKFLEVFHHRTDQRISWISARRFGEGGWECSTVAETLEAAGMWPMKDYIRRRQATIGGYIMNCLIYELCVWGEADADTYHVHVVLGPVL